MSKCRNENCTKYAGFGYKGGKRLYCSDHKGNSMINLAGKLCSYEGCIKQSSYAYKNQIKRDIVIYIRVIK